MKTPVLKTERLQLRPFQIGDGPNVFACWESDPEVARYMFWKSHQDVNRSIAWVAEEVNRIDHDNWYRFAIIEKTSGNLIGTGLLYYDTEMQNWEIAYNLGRAYWGRGYATEAMREILIFAKTQLQLQTIIARHATANPASETVLQKLGFVFQREIPYACNIDTTYCDGKLYELTL